MEAVLDQASIDLLLKGREIVDLSRRDKVAARVALKAKVSLTNSAVSLGTITAESVAPKTDYDEMQDNFTALTIALYRNIEDLGFKSYTDFSIFNRAMSKLAELEKDPPIKVMEDEY